MLNKETLKALLRHMLLTDRDPVLTPFAIMVWIWLLAFIYFALLIIKSNV